MGKQVNKEEAKKDEKVEEQKLGDKTDSLTTSPPSSPFVLFIDLHCVGCAKKIEKILKMKGIEGVVIDMVNNQVTLKGLVEPQAICNKIMKKTERMAKVVSSRSRPDAAAAEPVTQAVGSEAGELSKVELDVNMHCQACADQLKKKLLKIKGVFKCLMRQGIMILIVLVGGGGLEGITQLEVAGLLEGGEKPADILIPAWDAGKDLCIDVSIVSPFAGGAAVLDSGETARRAEERKITRYESGCLASGLIFEPFIMESLGGFGERADRLLRTVAARWAEAKGVEPPAALSLIRQKLSFVSQKALADGFLLRSEYT